MAAWNPLRGVRKAGTEDALTTLPVPSEYTVELQDVSQPDAGRTQDGKMHKKRIGQLRKLHLKWWNIDTATVYQILSAFQEEYLEVFFWDPVRGQYSQNIFYVGDRNMPAYSGVLDIWSDLEFNLIQRAVVAPYIVQ